MTVYLPVPMPGELYCIRELRNYPIESFAYITVIDGNTSEERVLFFRYPGGNYYQLIEDIKDLVPLHCARMYNGLVTFHRSEQCPCTYCEKE
jgi:hypothetical protein